MQKRRILIVEDDAIEARVLSNQLTALGHEPLALTATGEEALILAEQLRPDLVLIDGNHPELPQAFLSKPYEYEKLSNAVARMLSGKAEGI